MKTNTSRIRILFSVLFILVMALTAGCGGQATPAPAESQPEPVSQEAEEAAEEPAEEVAQGANWCSGVKIVFFPGGPQGGVFANNVYNGAKQAQDDLGADVQYVFSDWDPQKMIAQFKESAALKPDGIAVMGHPGDDAFSALIDDAVAQGIIVTSQNTPLPTSEGKYIGVGFGYVGADLYKAGWDLGKESVRRFELKEGDRAMVWGLLSQPTRGERTKGVIEALEDAGLTVDYNEIDSATNADPAAGASVFAGYVASNPDVKLVVTDHGGLTATMETYLKAAGKGPDDIFGVGFDLSPATAAAIQGGWTDLVIDQQPWLQGYLPILNICLTKVYGFSGLHIDTGAGFAHKDNIDIIAPLAEVEIR